MTSWCVEDNFRRYALLLYAHFLKHTTCTITNFSTTKTVVEILRRSGFEESDSGKIVLPTFLSISSWFNRIPVTLISDIGQIARKLNAEHRQILEDHASCECTHLIVKEPAEYCYIVAKRRKKRGIPFVDVLYCSYLTILERHFERIKIALLVKMKALVLLIDTRLFARTGLHVAWTIGRPIFYRSGSLATVTLVAIIEEQFGIKIRLEDMMEFVSFEAIADFVEKKLVEQ